MVSFEEKLKDNKVARWSDKYINYEKANQLLKKAKTAVDARDQFAARNPELAAKLKAEYEVSEQPTQMITPGTLDTVVEIDQEERSGKDDDFSDEATESFPLVEKNTNPKYYDDSRGEHVSVDKSFATKYGEKLKQADTQYKKYVQFLSGEREKCVAFYVEQVSGAEEQLENLIQTVQGTYELQTQPSMRSMFTRRQSSARLVKRPANKRLQSTMAMKHDINKSDVEKKMLGYQSDEDESNDDANLAKVVREVDSIKRALTELYRTAQFLNNYSMLNHTAFVRIVKKHNKAFREKQLKWDEILVNPDHYEGKRSQRLSDRMIELFAEWFCDGHKREAEAEMLNTKKGDSLQMDWGQLRLGYRLGICFTLTLWICVDSLSVFVLMKEGSIGGRSAFPVFRGCGGLLLVHWCWAISAYVWRRYHINYIFLFDFDPKRVNDPDIIFNACVDETIVFLVLMLLYSKSTSHTMPWLDLPGIFPLLLLVYTAMKLVFPLKTRLPLWKAIGNVVTSPIFSPAFFHTYVADVFTSMVKVFLDLLWSCCFIVSGDFLINNTDEHTGQPHSWQHSFWYKNVMVPLVCFFPLWIRLMQCLRRYIDTGKRFPNLANATKYALSQTVTLFGAFHPLYQLHSKGEHHISMNTFQIFWVVVIVSSSLFSYIWDVYMDWGLGRPSYAFLGPRLMFPNKYHYYGVMAADLILRFMWVQSLIPPSSGGWIELPAYLTAINMSVELLRRTLWGFFRLENEHRSNTSGYRKEAFVPLHFTAEHQHKYNHREKQKGWRVLVEVISVGAVVVIVSFLSIVVSQKDNLDEGGNHDL